MISKVSNVRIQSTLLNVFFDYWNKFDISWVACVFYVLSWLIRRIVHGFFVSTSSISERPYVRIQKFKKKSRLCVSSHCISVFSFAVVLSHSALLLKTMALVAVSLTPMTAMARVAEKKICDGVFPSIISTVISCSLRTLQVLFRFFKWEMRLIFCNQDVDIVWQHKEISVMQGASIHFFCVWKV